MHFGEKVIIFGMGERLKKLRVEGYLDGLDIVAYCDNDIDKLGGVKMAL